MTIFQYIVALFWPLHGLLMGTVGVIALAFGWI